MLPARAPILRHAESMACQDAYRAEYRLLTILIDYPFCLMACGVGVRILHVSFEQEWYIGTLAIHRG